MANFAPPWGNYLLDDLVETSAPVDITWWPQTSGWLLIIVLVALYLLVVGLRAYKRYQFNAYRRDALAQLERYGAQGFKNTAQKWPALLKKTAIAAWGRETVAPLSGAEWEQFLDQHCTGAAFVSRAGGLLYRLSYHSNAVAEDELAVIFQEIQRWVKNHRSQYD